MKFKILPSLTSYNSSEKILNQVYPGIINNKFVFNNIFKFTL